MRLSFIYVFNLLIASALINIAVAEVNSDLMVVPVKRINVPVIKQFTGTIEAVHKATMKAQTSGRLAEIYFDVDDIVKQGDVLARFRNQRQKAELDLANAGLQEAKAENERAQADYDRYQNLYEKKLVALSVVDQSRAALKASKARLDAANARIKKAREDYEYTIIRAPYSGIVTQRHVQVGESVSPGSPIVSGISLAELRVVVEVPQNLVESIRTQKQATIYITDGSVLKSEAITVFPFADKISHSFTVRVKLPAGVNGSAGSPALYPGMLVKTGFLAGEKQLLVIPEQAIAHRGEMNVVYVKKPDGRIAMRQIRAGHGVDKNLRVIHSGLSEGDAVYLNPLQATVALKQQISNGQQGNTHHE